MNERGRGWRMTSSVVTGLLVWLWVTVVRGVTTGCRSSCDPTCACSSGDIAIDTSVTTIGDSAFRDNTITSVDFTDCSSLTTIDYGAFAGNSITSVDFTGCSSLTTIDYQAFYDNSITSVDFTGLSSLATIGYQAFSYNPITSVDFTGLSSLTTIRDGAFSYNPIPSVNFTGLSSLISIGDRAFYGNSMLTSVDFTGCSSLTTIGASAFVVNSITSVDFTGCSSLRTIGDHAFYGNSITSLNFCSCSSLKYIDDYAFDENRILRVYLPIYVYDQIRFGERTGIDHTNIYNCHSTISSTISKIWSSSWSQHTALVVVVPVVFFLGICCWINFKQGLYQCSLALTFLCISLLSACVMFSDLYYLLFAYYYSYQLLLASAIFVLLPNVQFIVVLYDSHVFPHPLIDYYPGKIASDRGYTYKFWLWLSHDQGSPLINRQKQPFTFDHHDSLPKVFVFVVSWLALITLQLLSLTPYFLYLAVILPYYTIMLLVGCLLYQTKLLAYTPVWNTYMYLFTGKVNVYDKRGIEYDTSLLNESLLVQLLALSIAQVVLKAINNTWLGQSIVTPSYYLSLSVSVIAVVVGVALLALDPDTQIAYLIFTETFGLPKGTYDIRVNSEWIDLRKSYVLSTLLPYEVELASISFHEVIYQCFMNESTDITGSGVELFNSLRQLNMRPLHDRIEESIATRVFKMLLQDSTDFTMYRYLRSSGITRPTDLIGVSAATIRGIVTRLNSRSIRKLVDQYLRFLSPCSTVGVKDVVIWLMSKCNGAVDTTNMTLGANNRMTQQLSDIESNEYYQIELVGVPSEYNLSPGSEAVDGNMHGRGVYRYANGDVYEGDYYEAGNMHGRGVYRYANGDVYEGNYKDGNMHGRGVYRYVDGDVYEGDYEAGNMHGRGVFRYANGDVYEGDYKDGKQHGRGVYRYVDGAVYEGDYEDGNMHGRGVFQYANDAAYEGDFKDGKQHGRGVYRYADGSIGHDGLWEAGQRVK